MHFNSDFLTYEGGKTDFLGFDDGSRAIPTRATKPNVPTPISGASQSEVVDFIKSFNPQLGAQRQTSLMDYSLGISFGNQIALQKEGRKTDKDPKLIYHCASFKTDYKYYDDVTYGEYQRYTNPDQTELRYATVQTGAYGERNVLLGAIGGLAYKTKYSKLRLTLLHLQNGESRAGKFFIDNDGQAIGQLGYFAGPTSLNTTSGHSPSFLGGTCFVGRGWEIDADFATYSSSSDRINENGFTFKDADTYSVQGRVGNPSLAGVISASSMSAAVSMQQKNTYAEKRCQIQGWAESCL
jgi:hypothetical protein